MLDAPLPKASLQTLYTSPNSLQKSKLVPPWGIGVFVKVGRLTTVQVALRQHAPNTKKSSSVSLWMYLGVLGPRVRQSLSAERDKVFFKRRRHGHALVFRPVQQQVALLLHFPALEAHPSLETKV